MKNTQIAAILFLFTAGSLMAQSIEPEMADVFREEGKIYVVVAVCLVVLFGLVAYLTIIDRRVRRLEQETTKQR